MLSTEPSASRVLFAVYLQSFLLWWGACLFLTMGVCWGGGIYSASVFPGVSCSLCDLRPLGSRSAQCWRGCQQAVCRRTCTNSGWPWVPRGQFLFALPCIALAAYGAFSSTSSSWTMPASPAAVHMTCSALRNVSDPSSLLNVGQSSR